MTRPTVGILALQGDVREHASALEAGGAAVRRVRRPAELDGLDGLVLPGGESTVMEKLLRRTGLFDPLRAALSAGLPAYGSCAGLILLADRIANPAPGQTGIGGLDMTVRRNAFGSQADSFETDLIAPGFDAGPSEPPIRAVFIRAPWVEQTGPGVQVLARTRTGPERTGDRIVAVRSSNLLATAFHPEIVGGDRVYRVFLRLVEDARWWGPRRTA